MGLAVGVSLLALAPAAQAQHSRARATDADYIAKVMPAAPPAIVKGATIVAMDGNGAMRTVQKGPTTSPARRFPTARRCAPTRTAGSG